MKLLRRIRELLRRRQLDADMSEEMRVHLERLAAEHERRGLSPDEARYAALRRFGGVEQIKERCRAQRAGLMLENLRKDLRHGVRLLGRAPGFSFAAVTSLALGIAVVTAIFCVVDRVLLRPLPFPEAARLVTLWSENPRAGIAQQPSSYANLVDWRERARAFEGLAVYDPVSMVVTSGDARRTSGLRASPNLADVLRVRPLLGRMFTADEAERREPVAVIGAATWQRQFGGATDVLGQRVELDGRMTTIVGIMPEVFHFLDGNTEFWVPHTLDPNWDQAKLLRGAGAWRAVARLHAGREAAEAQAELAGIAAALALEYPAFNAGLEARVTPLAQHIVGRDLRLALWLLLAAVGAVLLIACSNVGNLLLARGLARQRELALRLSLGATRGRLVAQLLAENLVLCLFAAAAGLALAWLAIGAVRGFAPANLPRLDEIQLDPRVLGCAVLVSLVSASAFALVPALQSTGRDPHAMMRDGARGSTEGRRSRRLRGALVVGQFALAVMLFAGAGLLVRSFARVLAVDPGYQVDDVLFVSMRLPAGRPASDAIAYANAVLDRATALPGVVSAAISEEMMLGERGQLPLSLDGATAPVRVMLASEAITPDYFRTLGVGLRAGRFFTAADGTDAPAVAIVNEALAAKLWPGENPIGRRLRRGGAQSTAPWATVVGVVGNQRRQQLDRPAIPQVFWPLPQLPSRALHLIVRTAAESASLPASVRRAVREVDPTVPVQGVATLRGQIDGTLAPRRFQTRLLAMAALLALVLAAVGIFGLMHYAVVRRTHEIGVRAALGASARQIVGEVLGEGLTLAGVGIAIGLAGAAALSRTFATLLYEVSPTDILVLGLAAGTLLLVAVLACLLPARRAAKVDPMTALRAE